MGRVETNKYLLQRWWNYNLFIVENGCCCVFYWYYITLYLSDIAKILSISNCLYEKWKTKSSLDERKDLRGFLGLYLARFHPPFVRERYEKKRTEGQNMASIEHFFIRNAFKTAWWTKTWTFQSNTRINAPKYTRLTTYSLLFYCEKIHSMWTTMPIKQILLLFAITTSNF